VLAHSHVSWLDPYKVRRVTVVGEQRMAVFDDVAHDERLKILERGASYDAPAQEARGQSFGEYRAVLREGTITIPRLPGGEPLSAQFDEFLAAVREEREPYSAIAQGRDVVRVLEAAQRSLDNGGAPEQLSDASAGLSG
jgi:predicted dehydrogenase